MSKDIRKKLGNGRTPIVRTHVSKRGKTYKRKRVIVSEVAAPKWWRR